MINLLASELKLQGRHWSWWLAALLSLVFGWFVINKQTPDMDIQITGSYFLLKTFAIELLILPVLVSIFAAQATVRDFDSQMVSLVYACTVNVKKVLWARITALTLLCFFVYFSFSLGLVAGVFGHAELSLGLALSSLSWGLMILLLPGLMLLVSVFFAIGLRFKNSLYLYLFACLFFFVYQFYLMVNGSPLMASRIAPDPDWVVFLTAIDPYGLSGYFDLVSEWAPEQKNQMLPGLTAEFLVNRIAFVTIAILIAFVAISLHAKHFSLDSLQSASSNLKARLAASNNLKHPFKKIGVGQSIATFLPLSKFLVVAKMEWLLTFKTKTFLAMSAALAFVMGSEVYFGYAHLENMGTSAIASTMITMNRYLGDVLPRFGGLFILIVAADLCWRDSQSKFKQLIDSTPVSNAELFVGRWLALCFVPLFFVTLAIVVSVALQIMFEGSVDVSAYLLMCLYSALPLFWMTTLCIVIHALLPNKYLALLVTFLTFLWTESSLSLSAGFEHPMWTLGRVPQFAYSEITGFGGELDGFWGYIAFRFCLLMVLCLVAFKFFRRGEELSTLNATQTVLFSKITFPVALSVAGLFTLLTAGNIMIQTGYEGNFQSSAMREAWKADYEKRYDHLRGKPSLVPDAISTKIHLLLEEERFVMEAKYQLINRSDDTIQELVFTTPKPMVYEQVEVEGATLVEYDDTFRTHKYQFQHPIAPGQTATLSFVGYYQQNGYLGVKSDNFIQSEYTYIRYLRYLPWFGYVQHYQLKHDGLRDEHGLAKYEQNTLAQDMEQYAGDMSALYDWATLNTTIVTAQDHTAFAPGELVGQWTEGENSVFHYQTAGPVRNIGHVVSTPLPRKKAKVDHVELDVFYPDGKSEYAELHMQAMKDAVVYGNKHFGKLLANNVRLIPAPHFFPSTGYALPQTIFIGEAVGFHVDLDNKDGFDHIYRRTVHEVAHQWWGHGLNGAATEGEAVLIETLAKYTEIVLLEKKYGPEYVKKLIDYEQRRYFAARGRSDSNELPMYRADDNHLIYSKGAAAMYALKYHLGEQAINQALAKLVTNHSFPRKPAVTLDLIAYLSEDQSQENLAIIDDWFNQTDIHDFAVSKGQIKQLVQGYQLDLCVTDKSNRLKSVYVALSDEDGKTIDGFELKPDGEDDSQMCIAYQLEIKPSSITLDPDLLLLDSQRENNVYSL